MPDLQQFIDQIPEEEDRTLVREASVCLQAGAHRAAYITLWLAIAESVRRRFSLAAERDDAAGAVVGRIADLEAQHRAVDPSLIDEALSYGMVSDAEATRLRHIYENRCVFGHPYEQSPSEQLVFTAAAEGVEIVLGRPLRLRHNYLKRQAERLTSERAFLADDREAIERFVPVVADRSFPELWSWFLGRIAEGAEPKFADPDEDVVQRRACVFIRAFVQIHPEVLGQLDVVEMLTEYPMLMTQVFRDPSSFGLLDDTHPRDIVVNQLTQTESPDGLTGANELLDSGVLTTRQEAQVTRAMEDATISTLMRSRIPFASYKGVVNRALESHSWEPQNSAIRAIIRAGKEVIADLPATDQDRLGRNVMQAAEGNAFSAKNFLVDVRHDRWPVAFVRGIALEPFVSENGEFRVKTHQMRRSLAALGPLDEDDRTSVIADVVSSIRAATVRTGWRLASEIEDAIEIVETLASEGGLEDLAQIAEAIGDLEISDAEL